MTAISFAARLLEDGSLSVPEEAAVRLGLQPGDTVQIQVTAAGSKAVQNKKQNEEQSNGQNEISALDLAVSAMTRRTPEQIAQAQQRAMSLYLPRRTPPPGKTLADMVSGQWPGDETEEQIQNVLAELS